MRLVLGHDGEVGLWAAARIPHMEDPGPFVGFGIVDTAGALRGAALYHGYQPRYRSIEISFVLESPRFLSRAVIASIMAYPFDQLQVGRLTAVTPARKSAASARQFLETFGFKREGLVRDGYGDFGHAVIYGLTRKDWRESRFNPRRGRALDGQINPKAPAGA